MKSDQTGEVFEDHRDVKQGYGWHPLVVLIFWSGAFLFLIFIGFEEPYLLKMEQDYGWFYYVLLLAGLWAAGSSAAWYYYYRTTLKRLKFGDEGVGFQTFADFLNKREFGREVEKGEVQEIQSFYPGILLKVLTAAGFFDYHKPSYKLTLADGTVRYVMSGMPGAEDAVARLREFQG